MYTYRMTKTFLKIYRNLKIFHIIALFQTLQTIHLMRRFPVNGALNVGK